MEASVATPGQGAPAAGAQPTPGQGGAAGQSTAAGKGADATFNWGNFPDVPEAQRELLEPHLRNVQGHVTRLETQFAPYKGLMDAVTPDQVENLVGFLTNYTNDPASTILGLLQQAREDGSITPEQLQQLMGQQEQVAQTPAQPGQEEIPPWAQQIIERQQVWEQQQQAAQQVQQEMEQDQILLQAKTGIRAQLTQGGITEDLVDDGMIVAAIIASNGDEAAAAQMLTQMRDNFLGAFTNGKITGGRPPVQQGDVPTPPKAKPGRRGDPFAEAKAGAQQYLEQAKQAAASG